jgi:3-hydroxyisobutyrate dehydrogenase
MSAPLPHVTLLGTGTMGAGMARNLAADGLPTTVWNRTAERAAPLAEAGCTVATDLAQAVRGADVVVTMLFDAEATERCLAEAGDALAPGTLWIQTATVGVEATERFVALAAERGLVLIDAPVLGTKGPAESGDLVVLASGPDDAHRRAAPVFDAIGSRTMWVGPAGAGSRLKLAANAWVLSVVQGISESLALTRELGLDPALFLEAVRGGALDAPYVKVKGASMLAGDFAPAFGLSGAAKDAELILRAADSVGLDLAGARAVAGRLEDGVQQGRGDLDLSAIFLGLQPGRG